MLKNTGLQGEAALDFQLMARLSLRISTSEKQEPYNSHATTSSGEANENHTHELAPSKGASAKREARRVGAVGIACVTGLVD